MNQIINQRILQEEVWRTIKLERIEDDQDPKQISMFRWGWRSIQSIFRRLAYLWFVLISVLEIVTGEQDFRMLVPFLAVVILGAGLNWYQDRSRHQSKTCQDLEEFSVWTGTLLDTISAKEIKAGDIICIHTGDCFPADTLILAAGRPDHAALVDSFPYFGTPRITCKKAISETQRIIKSSLIGEALVRLRRLRGTVRVTQPLTDIGHFRGQIKLVGYPTASALSLESLVLKGCRLCYTPWVIGLVVYAGDDCKIEMNRSSTKRAKWSQVERLLNRFLIVYTIVIVAVSFLCAGLHSQFSTDHEGFWPLFQRFLLLWAQAVPASLYLLIDLARLMLTLFFCIEARNEPGGLWPHHLRLVEALGQVEYVFADKTGTLTENEMTLKTVRVGEKDYTRCGLEMEIHKQLCLAGGEGRSQMSSCAKATKGCESREDAELCGFSDLKSLISLSRSSLSTRFCECVALCNAVELTPGQDFSSQSRHEMALICGVVDLGVTVHEKTPSFCSLSIGDMRRNYVVLAVTDYKPSLKRMRVFVEQQDTFDGLLIVKGAVDVMKTIMAIGKSQAESLDRKVTELSKSRTNLFVYSFKRFSPSETKAITDKLEAMHRSESNSRKIEGLFKELEKDSEYIGFAGLEDPILPETAAAVKSIVQSGIKVWILTGDREASTLAAAVEVGLLEQRIPIVSLSDMDHVSMCKPILTQTVKRYILKETMSEQGSPFGDSLGSRMNDPSSVMHSIAGRIGGEQLLQRRSVMYEGKRTFLDVPMTDINAKFAISIDGTSFRTALAIEDTRKMLAALLHTAQTVLLHSMLPHQKALAVRFVRDNFAHRPITMSVGDEVNDISMIQEADIGVVVRRHSNNEVRGVCDFEVGSFHDLETLLLTQGKDAYRIIAGIAGRWMYASTVPVGLNLCYVYYCGFSATGIVTPICCVVYILLTGVFILVVDLMDSATCPQEKRTTVDPLRVSSLLWCLLLAIVHSGLLFLFIYTSTDPTAPYDLLVVRSFLCATLVTLFHFLISAEGFTVMATISFAILAGTMVFTLQALLEASRDDYVLSLLFVSPGAVLGECAAIGSCAVVSMTIVARKMAERMRRVRSVAKDVSPEATARTKRTSISTNTTLSNLYRDTPHWQLMQKHSNYKMHKKWLQFSSQIIESEYMREVMLMYLKKTPVVLFSVSLGIYIAYQSIVISFRLGQILLYSFAAVLLCLAPFLRFNLELVTSLQFILISVKFAVEVKYGYTDILSYLLPVAYSLFLVVDWKHNVALLGWNLLTVYYTIISFTGGSSDVDEATYIASTVVLQSLFTLSLAIFNYLNEKESRTEFHLLKITKVTVDRAKGILQCLFPSFVLQQIWNNQLPIALDQNLVTVLFCDICDFDAICSELSAQELMDLLDDLFKKLDDMCESYGMAKIETVGKTYLACAGLKEREDQLTEDLTAKHHALRACEMAFEIMNLFQEFSINGRPLRANIGINSGPVIAGVVGSEKPQFALIGDTVNTASRMSSTAPHPSSIQISSETYALMKNNLAGIAVTPRTLEVKGKGEMHVYLIQETEGRLCDVISPNVSPSRGRRGRKPNPLNLTRKELFGNWRFSTMLDREALAAALAARKISNVHHAHEEEIAFKRGAIKRQYQRLSYGFGMVTIVGVCELSLWAAEYTVNSRRKQLWPLIVVVGLCVLFGALFKRLMKMNQFSWIFCVFGLCYSVAISYDEDYYRNGHAEQTVLVQVLLIVYFQAQGALFLRHSIVFSVFLTLYWVGMLGNEPSRLERISAAFGILPALVLSLCFAHKKQHNLRVYTTFEMNVSEQMNRINELVKKMMPHHVYESLLDEKHKADSLIDVTMVFADIVGFTALSSRKTPTDMVALLNDLFSGFDSAMVQNHVYKVHTIGDCYVAMGYTGIPGGRDRREECVNILRQAFDMLAVIDTFNVRYPDLCLGMRIGVHTGQITAGITGAKIVRYDIYGADVLIANKMESSGAQGWIHVSEATKTLVESETTEEFSFQFNKDVEVKSLGVTVKGYFLGKKRIETDLQAE